MEGVLWRQLMNELTWCKSYQMIPVVQLDDRYYRLSPTNTSFLEIEEWEGRGLISSPNHWTWLNQVIEIKKNWFKKETYAESENSSKEIRVNVVWFGEEISLENRAISSDLLLSISFILSYFSQKIHARECGSELICVAWCSFFSSSLFWCIDQIWSKLIKFKTTRWMIQFPIYSFLTFMYETV